MRTRLFAMMAVTCALSGCSVAEMQAAVETGKDLAAERAAVLAGEAFRVQLLAEADQLGVDPSDPTLVATLTEKAWGGSFGPVRNGTVEIAVIGGVACLQLPTGGDDGATRPGPCGSNSTSTP